MSGEGTAKQIARWTALGALFLIPLTPLVVANSFFFPFITGKAFYFRILVEIAFSAWILLAFLDKEYRPRFSWIGIAVLAFLAWMLIADSFAINAAKAFWSNFERMEGWILVVHLAAFFFAAGAVLRVEEKWRAWFLTSLGVSVIISGHAILQLAGAMPIHQSSARVDASLGNATYLAIYFVFNVFIAGWLALTEKRAWLKWSLVALAALEAVLVFFTETRGAIVALSVGLTLAALLAALTAGKHARRVAAFALALIALLGGTFYLARDSSFVRSNEILERVASISSKDGEVRFMIWHMAWEGFLARPVTGWGQEGFNYVFDRFYDPGMYAQEPWFDRAHNAFIDWLIAGGAPAFLLFVSLFAFAVWFLWRRSELSRPERIALTCALVGYAIHDLFVFDNLYSYVYFFAILALIDSQIGRPIPALVNAQELDGSGGFAYGLPIAGIAAAVLVWTLNVSGMTVASGLITAISNAPDSPARNISIFKDLAAHPAFAAQEVREQMVSFASSVIQSQNATNEQKGEMVTLAIDEMKKQTARYPLDTRELLQLAYAYRAAGDLQDALASAQAALKTSPTKEEILTFVGATEWEMGDLAAAKENFDQAYALGPQFPELAAYAAVGAYGIGDAARGDAILTKAYGTTIVDSDILAIAYYRMKDWSRLEKLWELRTKTPDATAQTFFSLAAVYYTAGDRAAALQIVREAMARFPDAKDAGEAAIKQIESGVPAGR